MTTYATCGHDISDGEYVQLAIMDRARTGEQTVSYGTYCTACASVLDGWGIVLHDENEERAWRRGELKYPEMKK